LEVRNKFASTESHNRLGNDDPDLVGCQNPRFYSQKPKPQPKPNSNFTLYINALTIISDRQMGFGGFGLGGRVI
jgi:hypothetical protein